MFREEQEKGKLCRQGKILGTALNKEQKRNYEPVLSILNKCEHFSRTFFNPWPLYVPFWNRDGTSGREVKVELSAVKSTETKIYWCILYANNAVDVIKFITSFHLPNNSVS